MSCWWTAVAKRSHQWISSKTTLRGRGKGGAGVSKGQEPCGVERLHPPPVSAGGMAMAQELRVARDSRTEPSPACGH